MEGAPKYQPSEEEIKKAEESMTEEQKKMSDERVFDQWEPKDEHVKEYKNAKNKTNVVIFGGDSGNRARDYESLDIEELVLPFYPLHGGTTRIKMLPDGRILTRGKENINYATEEMSAKVRENVLSDLESKKAEYEKIGREIKLLEKAKEVLDKKTA